MFSYYPSNSPMFLGYKSSKGRESSREPMRDDYISAAAAVQQYAPPPLKNMAPKNISLI